MNIKTIMKSGAAAIVLAGLIGTQVSAAPAKSAASPSARTPQRVITLEVGSGEQVNLPVGVSDVVVSNPGIADVDVRNPKQLYIFGKTAGQSTIYATDASGRNVYSAQVQVAQNVNSVDQMLAMTMPESDINVTFLNGIVLLTGTVAQPEDVLEAEGLVRMFIGDKQTPGDTVRVVSRLKTAVPMQVNLQVRIAEVSRTLSKEISSNFKIDPATNGGITYGIAGGARNGVQLPRDITNLPRADACARFQLDTGCGLILPFDPATNEFIFNSGVTSFIAPTGRNVLALAGKIFGLNAGTALDLAERSGLAVTLAQPNLTTVSGETAEFVVGGQLPIPLSDINGNVTVDYKNYGISLKYTPTVLSDGRINLRVRPEVSELTSAGAVRLAGTEIPGIATRMAETTVELGSGESFMIAGLMQNGSSTSVDKYPGLGDVPVLGALFKSNGWKRNESELMIVVTPYLVKPVSDSEIKLPTDGFKNPNDLERVLLNKQASNTGSAERPMPKVAPDVVAGPEFGAVSQAPPPVTAKPVKQAKAAKIDAGPGFSF
ncbi:MAG: type II and III secretion system protein family protein [Sphingorhabdus sp.]